MKLNKIEIKFFTDLFGDIMTENELNEFLDEQLKVKRFLKELKRLEKENGYRTHEYNIINIPLEMSEDLEFYIYDNDGKKGAKQYFKNRY